MAALLARVMRVWAGYWDDLNHDLKEETEMLWLIAGVVLLVIAIAGGAIVHPILFALGILALFMFFAGRTRTV